MKKKQNVFKPPKKFHIFKILSTLFSSLVIVSFFALIGYSVAKPFGKVGETQSKVDVDFGIEDDNNSVDDNNKLIENAIVAYWLAEAEIKDFETLERMVERIGDSYNTVVVPLKISGGKLNYNSINDGAIMANVNSEIEIGDIITCLRTHGYKPAASLNTLNDNLYPKADKSSGFTNKEGGTLWYDAAEKSGGKAWLSPTPSSTSSYLTSLTLEISSAGFEYIITTGTEYPQFSRIAFDAIGESVTNENRYLDLVSIVNKIAGAAESKNRETWIEVSALEMFTGTCEVFQPLLLETDKIVLEINIDDFKSVVKIGDETVDFSKRGTKEKIEKVCDIAETYIYKTSFIPEVTGKSISSADKNTAVEALKGMGYYSYIIR